MAAVAGIGIIFNSGCNDHSYKCIKNNSNSNNDNDNNSSRNSSNNNRNNNKTTTTAKNSSNIDDNKQQNRAKRNSKEKIDLQEQMKKKVAFDVKHGDEKMKKLSMATGASRDSAPG